LLLAGKRAGPVPNGRHESPLVLAIVAINTRHDSAISCVTAQEFSSLLEPRHCHWAIDCHKLVGTAITLQLNCIATARMCFQRAQDLNDSGMPGPASTVMLGHATVPAHPSCSHG
jgi:hypothetical protein